MSTPTNNNSDLNARLLLICTIGAGFSGVISVYTGWAYVLLSVILSGIVQLFGAVLAYCLYYISKLKFDKNNNKLLSENADLSKEVSPPTGEETTSPSAKSSVLPFYRLDTFLRRDYYIVLGAATAAGLVTIVNVLLNLSLIAQPLAGNFFLIAAVSIIISFCYMFGANWLNHQDGGSQHYEIISHFFRAAQVIAFLSSISIIIKTYGFYHVEYILVIIISVLLSLSLVEVGLNAVSRLLVKPEDDGITINLHILPAILSGRNPFGMLLLSLEKRSGITIRSAWTYRFFRKSIPPLFITAVLLFWLMTGLIQINTDEKGIKYRFGQLQKEDPLLPGLHLKWPWPIETVQVFPAYSYQQFTVGYDGGPRSNYLWTSFHGGGEEKFLLGNGRELVSVNMLVTYKISNLKNYVTQFENPEDVLQAYAYEILMQEIVKTDLDDLLSRDRAGLSVNINNRLQKISRELNLGLEVVNVALPSIHPPVEIARDYQEFVGAQIQKQILIIQALTDKNYNLPFGEEMRNRLIAEAKIKALTDLARARSEESKSVFQKKAYASNPGMYEFLKWLESFENAVEGKHLYLIVDEGDIWLDMRDFSMERVDVYE